MSELPQVPAPRCVNLYCKSMMVFGEAFESDPDYQAGMTDFWCLRTSKGLGPDDQEASMDTCRDPERPCYAAF
jgi:hypothetical protein